MEPNPHVELTIPEGMDPRLVFKDDPTNQVPLINKRWKEGYNFGRFEYNTFQQYYQNNS